MEERKKAPRVISLRLQCWLGAIPFFGMYVVLFIGLANVYRYFGGRKYMFCYFFACCLPMVVLFAAVAGAVWALQGAVENSAVFMAIMVGICCVACWCGAFSNLFLQSRFLRRLRAREERRRQADLL